MLFVMKVKGKRELQSPSPLSHVRHVKRRFMCMNEIEESSQLYLKEEKVTDK
jgi:hypothetical protein